MNFTPNSCGAGVPLPCRNVTLKSQWRSFVAVSLLLLAGLTANATDFTFNNTGCQTVKVYKVFLLFENFQTNVNAGQSYYTSSASWGEKWVYRSMNGNYLGEYVIPWLSSCSHDFNSGGGPSVPTVGNITHPTCNAMGSVTLNGLPNGNWTLTRNPGGVITTGSGSSTTITGLDAGSYSFSVNQSGCTASAAVNATLNAAPVASSAPALYSNTVSNVCPATTISLNSIAAIFVPSGYSLSWHTGTPATASNKVSNPGAVAAGTYYATFYNAGANCYSGNKTTQVTATVGSCNDLVRNKNRSLDGSMNNLSSSVAAQYGKSGSAFSRELPAAYADGLNSLAGPNRPNPRALSNKLSQELEDDHNDREMSGLFYIWGQFIDHDMTDNSTDPTQPANISLPSNESIFTNPIAFNRSKVHPGTGVTTPRDQTNLNTAWIDASQVYGWTPQHAAWLRSFSKGKLKTSKGDLLPFNTLTGEYDSPIDPNAPRMDDDQGGTKKTFVAGDHRCAEHPGTTSLHTTFLREHNRICDELVAQGMTNDEEIYQRARKIIGAMIQHITYTQWMESMGIQLSSYTGYKPHVHPNILNTFSAGAYRWHTMVENDIILRDNECNGVGQVQLPLRDIFFNIEIVRTYDIGVILKGLSVHRQYETDLKVNGGLRNFLAGNFGSDLVSINIQRGRDHGLPSYNDVRQYYTGTRAYSFMDIAGVDSTAQKLASIYSSPDDVDLWVGLYAEPRMPGKSIGKTVNALIVSQFEKLRDGDFYFYKNDPELSGYLSTILSTNLDDIISRNSTAGNFQDNVFFRKFCTPEGDDIAKTPCNVISEFTGWTHLGNSSHSKFYRWDAGSMNFADAKTHVSDYLAATLPQINDLTENNQLQGYLGGQEIWLDMVRTGTGSSSSSWRRSPVFNNDDILVQGQNVSYFRWRTGEPNNSGGTENRVQFKSDGKWNDIVESPLQVVVAELGCDNVNAPCVAGKSAPALMTFTTANICPSTTVDLTPVVAANKPKNTVLTWHTGAVPSNSNKISNITALGAGTYYAAFYSAANNCYSSKTTAYKVTVNVCDPCATNNFSIDCEKNINNAGWFIVADCNVSVCPGEKVMLSVNPNGYPTTWTGPNGFVANTNDILVGTSVILANAGNYTATVNVNGCIKTKTITLQVRDTDGDGVCNDTDCQPNNPAFPAVPGTACNDNNANTTNDVVTANGCGCAGTPVNNNPDCANIVITASSTGITVNGLNGAPVTSLQVFSSTWQPQFSCFANCGATQSLNLPAGSYYVFAKYYTAGYALICEKQVTVTVGGNGGPCANQGGDSDGDGVCNNNDCQPNNPAFPATPGTACNDGNPNTNNDVVTSNGCGCAGTPVAPVCDNITSGGTIGFGSNCLAATQHCPNNGAAPAITNCGAPYGGSGNLEIMWLRSNTSCSAPTTTAAQIAAGLDPHWSVISGATGLTLDPGTVTANTCYLRCSRRAGCDVFLESNIISLTIPTNCTSGPNCANITITPGAGNIMVGGLGGAPVVSVQIFNSSWQQLHNCFANCGNNTATYAVPAGSYYVYVKYYSANYQLVCEVNQTVNVTTALAGTDQDDFRFEVIKHAEHTELFWSNRADELVNSYVVERSLDGIQFEEMNTQVAENIASGNEYNDFDLSPKTGDNFYRIKLLNLDGTIGFSAINRVNYEDLEDFTVFPNPANSFTSLNLDNFIGKQVDIQIYNNKGLRMKTYQVDEVFSKFYQLDLRDLHEGQYIILVSVEGRRPVAKKLIIGRF